MTGSKIFLAQRLRAAREHAGLSQGQVAKLLKYHRPTISEIEAGRRRVSAQELSQFARMYGVQTSWLMSEEEEIPAEAELAARELAKLKKEDLDLVLRLIASIRTGKRADK